MIKTGILGGTFDPIHTAHIAIARRVRRAMSLQEIWILPDGDPPHKRTRASAEDRLRMAELAVEGESGFSASGAEIQRQGTTYTLDTLLELRRILPDREWVYIIGGDTLYKIETWHEFRKIAPLCEMAVVARAGTDESALSKKADELRRDYGFRIRIVRGGNSDISSSEIRRRVARGLPTQGLLADSVRRYIDQRGLYRDERIDRLRSALPPARFTHTLGVEETARSLAERYGVDPEKAAEAALFHDCAKCGYTAREMIRICEENGVPIDRNERAIPQILHAPAGAALARSLYGVTDPEVLEAIRWHTTGRAGLTKLEKIVFLADAIEPNRKPYPGIETIRTLARNDIDRAICESAKDTQAYVASRSMALNPKTAEMLAELQGERNGGTEPC